MPGLSPIKDYCLNSYYIDDEMKERVMTYEGCWNWEFLEQVFSLQTPVHIGRIRPPSMRAGSDMCVWRCVDIGRFSVAKAYRYLAEKSWEPTDNRWLQVRRSQAAQCCGLLCEGSFYLKNASPVSRECRIGGHYLG